MAVKVLETSANKKTNIDKLSSKDIVCFECGYSMKQ